MKRDTKKHSAAKSKPEQSIPPPRRAPTPSELIDIARSVMLKSRLQSPIGKIEMIGAVRFPENEDQRDALLRSAAKLWLQADGLLKDYISRGPSILDLTAGQREQARRIKNAGQLQVRGYRALKEITKNPRRDRALVRIAKWRATNPNLNLPQTLAEWEQATFTFERIMDLRSQFSSWNAGEISRKRKKSGRSRK